MGTPKPRKPFSTLANDLKLIRRRPITDEQIAQLNQIFDEIELRERKKKRES
jgi:hypothetical protein